MDREQARYLAALEEELALKVAAGDPSADDVRAVIARMTGRATRAEGALETTDASPAPETVTPRRAAGTRPPSKR